MNKKTKSFFFFWTIIGLDQLLNILIIQCAATRKIKWEKGVHQGLRTRFEKQERQI